MGNGNLELELAEVGRKRSFDFWSLVRFRATIAGHTVKYVRVTVSRDTGNDWMDDFALKGIADESAIRDLVIRRAVVMAEALLRGPALHVQGKDEITIDIPCDDFEILLALARQKSCSYRVARGRDLFCSALSSWGDRIELGDTKTFTGGPTSTALCEECSLPPTDILCSHLLNPIVSPSDKDGRYRRRFDSALCELGKTEIADVPKCRPGGHPCWRREILPEDISADALVGPLAL